MRILTLTGLLWLAACSGKKADPCGDPEAFVRGVYGQYTDTGKGAEYEAVFTFDTMALIKRDGEAAQGVGALDHDPICNCQDWQNLTVTDVRVTRDPTLVAAVAFRNGNQTFRQNMQLVCEGGGLRVHDIVTLPAGTSLRALLRQ